MGKPRLFTLFRWLFLIALSAAGIWYAVSQPELLEAISDIPPLWLVPLCIIILAGKTLQGLQLKVLTAMFGVQLTFREWFGLTVSKSMYAYLIPGRPGLVLEALYLKQIHELPVSRYLSVFTVTNILSLLVGATQGMLGCIALLVFSGEIATEFIVIMSVLLGVVVLGCICLLIFGRIGTLFPDGRIRHLSTMFSEGMMTLISNRRALIYSVVYTFLRMCLGGLALCLTLMLLGVNANIADAIILNSSASFGVFLPLTPASIGIQEGIVAAGSRLLDISADRAMVAALVRRGAEILVIFASGWAANHFLLGKFARKGLFTSAKKEDLWHTI